MSTRKRFDWFILPLMYAFVRWSRFLGMRSKVVVDYEPTTESEGQYTVWSMPLHGRKLEER